MPTATTTQMAAAIQAGESDLPGPEIVIYGSPGLWSVAIPHQRRDQVLWLASTREPAKIRDFKTLDAAHAAALAVHQTADPIDGHRRAIRIQTTGE